MAEENRLLSLWPGQPKPPNPLLYAGGFADTKADADAVDNAVALEHSIQHGDRSTQLGNFRRAAGAGAIDFVSANQLPRRVARGAPYIPDDEIARLRQNYPAGYYGGQGLAFAGTGLLDLPVAGVLAGAAIANNPAVQRWTRDLSGWLTSNPDLKK